MNKIVITGGPGVGKTTVIELLAERFNTVPEAARIVIEKSLSTNSDVLPWENVQEFQIQVSALILELESRANADLIFCDRGIVDGYAYSIIDQIAVPDAIINNARDRYSKVFVLDQLPFLINDDARKEDTQKALQIQKGILEAYIHFGYNPIQVPVLPPVERMSFILSHI